MTHYPQHVQPKNPALALAASFVLPGLGSLIASRAVLGFSIFGLWLFAWLWLILFPPVGVALGFAAWIWGMVDAYAGAKRWNVRHGVPS